MDSKLFAEKPLWQKDKTRSVVTIRVAIEDCQDWEAGLALFLLKDLWTGQVALGGDKSVGRGYLTGHHEMCIRDRGNTLAERKPILAGKTA